MMKSVFALVVLLHFCYSYKSNMTLNREIMQKLEKLNKLYSGSKANITLSDTLQVPSNKMTSHANFCVSVFVGNLTHILDNVTVHEESEDILVELKANLKVLDPQQNDHNECVMVPKSPNSKPFYQYIHFIRKLNSKKR